MTLLSCALSSGFATKIVYMIRLLIFSVRAMCLPNLTCLLKTKRMN